MTKPAQYDRIATASGWAQHAAVGIIPGTEKLPGGPKTIMLPRRCYTLGAVGDFLTAGKSDLRLADLGGGSGELAAFALLHPNVASVAVTDASQKQLDTAAQTCSFAEDRARFVRADFADDMDLPSGSVDAVTMTYVLSELSTANMRRALETVARILVPGGAAYIEDLAPEIFAAALANPDAMRPLVVRRDANLSAVVEQNPAVADLPTKVSETPSHADYAWVVYKPDGGVAVALPYTDHSDQLLRETAAEFGLRLVSVTKRPIDPRHSEANKALAPYTKVAAIVRQMVFVRE